MRSPRLPARGHVHAGNPLRGVRSWRASLTALGRRLTMGVCACAERKRIELQGPMPTLDNGGRTTVLRRTGNSPPSRSWLTWLIGRPLQTADAPHQTIGRTVGLAGFASDAR